MDKSTKNPLLTIGIIFKDNIRSLKRCLDALAPLRQTISCELVMADTGSSDGSREIAAQYADILFDQPWEDDFSAARNSLIKRASGKWFLTVDSDEYLDPDITELADFLRSGGAPGEDVCAVVQRNYDTMSMDGGYSDFLALRIVRMSARLFYKDAIHESWDLSGQPSPKARVLPKTILHHDGYVGLNSEKGKAKRERNLRLLRESIKKEPTELRLLLEYLDSAKQEPDYMEILSRATALVDEKCYMWKEFGPTIFCRAVRAAYDRNLPELDEWIARAQKTFPDSIFTRIDVGYTAFAHSWDNKDYASCIRLGKECLQAMRDYLEGRYDQTNLLYGSLMMGSAYWEQALKIYLAGAYLENGEPEKSVSLMEELDCTLLDGEQTGNLFRILRKLHAGGGADTSGAVRHFYEEAQKPVPNKEQMEERMQIFYKEATLDFTSERRAEEQAWKLYRRPSYTMFLPLGEACEPGRAAVIMETEGAGELEFLLGRVENWDLFPIQALCRCLEEGILFPLPEKPLKLEEMEALAARAARDGDGFFRMFQRVMAKGIPGDLQSLLWIQALALQAVRAYNWGMEYSEKPEVSLSIDVGSTGPLVEQQGEVSAKWQSDGSLSLPRFFARVEGEFLPRYYAPGLLCEGSLDALPALHRFGWHCARAFRALDTGDTAGYVRGLREGLESCPGMKPVVEYMTKHTPGLRDREEAPAIPPELASLAEQVRRMLAAYPPDAPEVKALKASPAYQKVAWLVEDR